MKVYIKNKFWSIGGSSSVVNENNEQVFKVKGRAFSPTHVKYVLDKEGNKLYKIRNKFINWFEHKAFIYDKDKRKIATVKDKFVNVNQEFFITGYSDEIKIQGKFFGLTSQILKNGNIIGTIKREITIVNDAFELEANEEDIPFLIAIVIAIDNITDKKRQ